MASKLESAFAKIDKEIGKGIVIDSTKTVDVSRIILSSIGLNYLFNGGFPEGRIVEFFGPESSGKSLISTAIGADYQRAGKFVVYVDMEGTFMPSFAVKLGLSVDPDKFRLIQPETGEDAFRILEALAETGEVGLIIVDSVAAMTPTAELEGDYGEANMGLMARMMSQGMRKLNGKLKASSTSVIFINQIRMKIGVMYGSPETTSGGRALAFYASSRNRVARRDAIVNGAETVGVQMQITNKKSKIGPPSREMLTAVYFDTGLDTNSDLSQMAGKLGIINKAGSWYDLPNGERVQGKDAVSAYLSENPAVRDQVFADVYENLFGQRPDLGSNTIVTKETVGQEEEEQQPKKKRKSRKSTKKEDEIEISADADIPESPTPDDDQEEE